MAQWLLLDLGRKTGHTVHVAAGDRSRNVGGVRLGDVSLPRIPWNVPDHTRRIMEHIDVIWFRKGTTCPCALFEVEHTTSITSGLLRMSDVMTTVDPPPGGWRCVIVGPDGRRGRFTNERSHPTFNATGLSQICVFLSYDELLSYHRSSILPAF